VKARITLLGVIFGTLLMALIMADGTPWP